jgi:hypothetical protein
VPARQKLDPPRSGSTDSYTAKSMTESINENVIDLNASLSNQSSRAVTSERPEYHEASAVVPRKRSKQKPISVELIFTSKAVTAFLEAYEMLHTCASGKGTFGISGFITLPPRPGITGKPSSLNCKPGANSLMISAGGVPNS